MAYCTQADVETDAGGAERLVQLADWDRDTVPDPDRISSAIRRADALIDTFASKRFHVPFAPVPTMINQYSATLAKLTLVRNRRRLTQNEQDDWDAIAGTDERKPGWLLLLAKGVVTPGSDPLPPKHGTMTVDSVDTALPGDRDLSRDKLGRFW